MTPLKQLFRQPVRLFAIFLLVGMASAFICLSAGVFASAKATLAQIEERYVTIGVPTTETADVATEYNGLTLHHEESVISQDMWAYMDQLAADGTVIKGAYQQKYISAYCPSIQSVTSGKEDGTYVPSLDSPYNRAIMIVRVTSVDKTNLPESTELALVSVTASIENVVKMHPDYAVRSTLRLIIGCNSQEELDALDIRPGGRYLAFGADYIDRDLELRTTLAGTHRCSVEDIDLSKISYDLTEDEKKTASPDFLPVAKYSSGEKTTILGQDMVDAIDSCTMTVTHWHGLYSETQLDYAIDGSETGVLLNDQYLDAYMTPLETDLDVFLSSNAGIEWRSAVQELDTQYHTVSVIGTDLLESMYCFHQKDSFVTEGRSFGADDYKNGSNVCLISETTAIASGLGIGDSIDLSFYWGPNPLADLTAPEWKVQPQRFSQKIGVSGDAKTYQIIGIYRQSDLWDTADYRFLPNTVFVPNTSLPENCYSSRNGVFFTYVLQNGKVSALQAALESNGYPANILFCFDNGYTEIAETLHGFYSSAQQLLFAACITASAALFVFLALFVNRQRRTLGLMLSLGSGKRTAVMFSWEVAAIPIILATITGIIVGILTMNATTLNLFADIKAGRIKRVIVKDMSRFGRDYLQVGMYVSEHEAEFIQDAAESDMRDRDAEFVRKRETLAKADTRIAELDRIISRLYEDNVIGKLSDERFIKMSHDYELEQSNLKSMAEVLRKDLKQQEQQKTNVKAFIAAVKKYTDLQELDAAVLRAFIDRIEVSHVDKKSRTREITIVYNFIGAFDFTRAIENARNTSKKEQRTA